MNRTILRSNAGVSLVEILVAAAIMTMMMLVFASMNRDQARSNQAMSEKLAWMSIKNQLGGVLADGTVCMREIAAITPSPTVVVSNIPGTADINLPQIHLVGLATNSNVYLSAPLPAASGAPAPAPSPFANTPSVSISGIKITSFTATSVATAAQATLEVDFGPSSTRAPLQAITYPVNLQIDSTTGAINSCSAGNVIYQ